MEQDKALRDEFAAAAIASGMLIGYDQMFEVDLKRLFGHANHVRRAELYAAQAYEIADALMERRKK